MKRLVAWSAVALIGAALTVGPLVFGQAAAPPSSAAITVTTASPLTGNGSGGSPVDCQDASAVQAGCVTTGTQTFAGAKTIAGSSTSGLTVIGVSSGNPAVTIPSGATVANAAGVFMQIAASGIVLSHTFTPAATNTDFGASNAAWRTFFLGTGIRGTVADGASAVAVRVGNVNSLTTDGAEILALYSDANTTKKLSVDKDGKLIIPTGGAADTAGTATLSSGTVTVNTTAVESTSKIYLSHGGTGTAANFGILSRGTITADTSFVINSSNALDNDTVNWWIVN